MFQCLTIETHARIYPYIPIIVQHVDGSVIYTLTIWSFMLFIYSMKTKTVWTYNRVPITPIKLTIFYFSDSLETKLCRPRVSIKVFQWQAHKMHWWKRCWLIVCDVTHTGKCDCVQRLNNEWVSCPCWYFPRNKYGCFQMLSFPMPHILLINV